MEMRVSEELDEMFHAMRKNIKMNREDAVGQAVKSATNVIDFKPSASQGSTILSEKQLDAFEAAVRVWIHTVSVGASRRWPDFRELYDSFNTQLLAAGWSNVDQPQRELITNCVATANVLSEAGNFSMLKKENDDENKARHAKLSEHVLNEESEHYEIEWVDMTMQSRSCSNAIVYVRWEDWDNAKHTQFDVHLFFDDEFSEAAEQIMLMELFWRMFRRNYCSNSRASKLHVSGSQWIQFRDGTEISFSGRVSDEYRINRVERLGFRLFPVQMSAKLHAQSL